MSELNIQLIEVFKNGDLDYIKYLIENGASIHS